MLPLWLRTLVFYIVYKVTKVMERLIEGRSVRKIVKIDNLHFGFMAGRGMTDAIFIVHQLQEKYPAEKKDLWMAKVDF